jgi:hypothetical protein
VRYHRNRGWPAHRIARPGSPHGQAEDDMTQERFPKEHGPIDEVRDRTGLYKLGFELSSFLGFSLPFVAFGGAVILALILYYWL